jgi:hypothetical protein
MPASLMGEVRVVERVHGGEVEKWSGGVVEWWSGAEHLPSTICYLRSTITRSAGQSGVEVEEGVGGEDEGG